MNLFLQVQNPVPSSDWSPLTILGAPSGSHGLMSVIPLSMSGNNATNFIDSMNLSLKAAPSVSYADNMNMFVHGTLLNAWGSIPLTLANSTSSDSDNVTLFVQVGGSLTGGQLLTDQMNLYLAGKPGSTSWTPLEVWGNQPTGATVYFSISGVNTLSSQTLPLVLAVPEAPTSGIMTLYTHGY